MPDYWITTHWPIPVTNVPFSRHVFVKKIRVTLPKPGAVVFIREAIDARDKNGRRVQKVDRHHHGNIVRGINVPKGTGGIIGVATVDGTLRDQVPADVVLDYGDLREWMVIPCRGFQPAALPLDNLRTLLRKGNVRGLNLWPLKDDELGAKLLKALRH
jgi:hypothetical protein